MPKTESKSHYCHDGIPKALLELTLTPMLGRYDDLASYCNRNGEALVARVTYGQFDQQMAHNMEEECTIHTHKHTNSVLHIYKHTNSCFHIYSVSKTMLVMGSV